MHVAITGAAGFTGQYLLREFRAHGIDPVALTADLTDPDAVAREVEGAPIDCLIHLAGKAFAGARDWRGFYEVNLIGTMNLLEAVARYHPNCRCIMASTAQVYGPSASGLVDEDANVCPSSPYAISKYAMERSTQFWADRLEILIVRPFNYTGVHQSVDYLIPKIVDHFRRRAPYIELGNIDVERDFGDVRAVARAYRALSAAAGQRGIVNICTGRLHALREVISLAEQLTGHWVEVRVNEAFVRRNEVKRLGGCAQRLQSLLPEWQPIPLDETLAWMLSAPTARG